MYWLPEMANRPAPPSVVAFATFAEPDSVAVPAEPRFKVNPAALPSAWVSKFSVLAVPIRDTKASWAASEFGLAALALPATKSSPKKVSMAFAEKLARASKAAQALRVMRVFMCGSPQGDATPPVADGALRAAFVEKAQALEYP